MSKPNATYKSSDRIHKLSFDGRTLFVKGMATTGLQDIYFICMTMSWRQFYGSVAVLFFMLNVVFALLYLASPSGIANQYPMGFWGAFFFSVETLATVGYGDMHPANIYTHVISTLEIFVGMMGIALTTGLTFARFSRPRARIITSRHPVVSNHNGQPALMIRAANARQSMIVQASANLYLLIQQTTTEGKSMRSLLDLKLMRNVHPMFILSWTLIHIIDESSPLYGHDAQSLQAMRASVVLTINGADEITTQTMRSRHVYSHQDLRWDHEFEDMLSIDDKGHEHVDYERLHAIRRID